MLVSKEQKLNIIANLVQNHEVLHPKLFDKKGILYPVVHQKIWNMVEVYKKMFLSFIPVFDVCDVILTGSICGYTYTPNSDLDLLIMLENKKAVHINNEFSLLQNVTLAATLQPFHPYIYGHFVDWGIVSVNDLISDVNVYSVLNNCWKSEPIRQEYPFTVEQLFKEYCKYSADLHKYVADLKKINGAFLTSESCYNLKTFLNNLKYSAYNAKKIHPLREYCLEYNLYRIAKKFGVFSHFYSYIRDSNNYLMSLNNGN